MTREGPHTGAWLGFLCPRELPQSNASIDAPTGEQAPIGTPGQREHRAERGGERLGGGASGSIPELDGGIISAAGECASIGGKGQAFDVVGEPARPEQGPALYVPQLDGTIPAPSSQRVSIRAEGEGAHRVAMRLPGQVQEPPSLLPHACFPPPSARSPVLPIAADGHRPGDIKGLVQDRLTQESLRKAGILP